MVKKQMSDEYKCIYCDTCFSTSCALNKHSKTARYCLKKRDNHTFLQCVCKKQFINEKMIQTHKKSCLANQLYEENQDLKSKNVNLLEKNKKLKKENQSFVEEIARLKGVTSAIQSDKNQMVDIVTKAALKSNITNNNQYNLSFPLDLSQKVFDDNAKYITHDVILQGQKGLADFFIDRIATNKNGDIGVVCTNQSRKIFKYLDQYGNIVPDIEAKKIIESLKLNRCCSIQINKSLAQIWNEYQTENDFMDKEIKFDTYRKIQYEINTLGGPFVAQLIQRTYKQTADGKLEKVEFVSSISKESNSQIPINVENCTINSAEPIITYENGEKCIDGTPESVWNYWAEHMS